MGGGREDDGIPAVQKTNANPPGFQTALFSPFPRRPARRVGTAERALVGFADDSAPEPLGRARGAMAAAVAYHERDFDYDEHVAEVLATRPAPGSEARDAEPAPGDDASARTPEAQRSAWDRFHAAHARGAFFKPRRYLLAAFPALAAAPAGATSTVLELGCGSGSACVPVLAANPTARVLACDCAPEAVACAARRGRRRRRRRAGIVCGRASPRSRAIRAWTTSPRASRAPPSPRGGGGPPPRRRVREATRSPSTRR